MTNVRDIARLAGVSPSTVSRALNGHPQIAESTRERIQALATEFQYVPNRLSHGIFTGDSGLLGCITHPNIGPGYSEMLQGVMEQAYGEGYGLITLQPIADPPFIYQAVRTFLGMRVQGILFAHAGAPTFPEDLLFTIRSSGTYLVDLSQAIHATKIDQISIDSSTAFGLVIDYLYQLGHRAVALFYSPSRRNDYHLFVSDICKRFGMTLAYKHLVHDVPALEESFEAVFQTRPKPTAIIIQNDLLAWKALLIAERRRIRVPDDLSIVGLGDLYHGYYSPELTTVDLHYREAGCEAIKLVCRRVQEKAPIEDITPESIAITPKLVVRQTAAPPPRHPVSR